ncbi:hypothetical protein A3A46_02000 [Candidatus Roizmanbacteria bacterium RIFCSPLOWO2_01_FULL_37_13]|uniref:Uncharacterized protein n=1 Tax=Candidatus Roizmanbacteria bacterium RIFCSPHIGHO2_02_FULL_38_11 TaxID=1802039 RepID=A0A1F7GXV4_9BACT|nr:MAG: hypothetical protein A3C25_01025 [Candidatus Roizmanbacteria bacterium RIFCSPHIGHO2_02_FULL_38_11]OGK42857.1 MAG: hypothetical protein A3A46_02000 [Candidatus Roizmanbacteria bacterium RIFCSPLOWO2_01_FULL_37_13]
MKKVYIYILILSLFLVVVASVYYFLSRSKPPNEPPITPIPTIIIPTIQDLGPTLTQDEKEQLESDKEFGRWTKEIYDTYPWYDKLPLRTQKYFVYYDIYERKFIADIYLSGQQDAIKNEVLTQLKNIGINTNQYEVVWVIK